MKKLFKHLSKGLCLLLAVIMSVAVVGCGENEGGNNGGNSNAVDPLTQLYEFGTHVYTAPEIEDKWLVQNGKSEYIFVIPETTVENDKQSLLSAREEFIRFFQRSTGVTLEVKVDTTLPETEHNENQKYISLGQTTLLKSLDGTENAIDYSKEECGYDGGKIVTVDNNIYIIGFTNRGTYQMVYTFLQRTFNWECYSANTVVYDENVTDLKLRDYKIHDIPDAPYSVTSGYERSYVILNRDYSNPVDKPTEGSVYYGHRVRALRSSTLNAVDIFMDATPEEAVDLTLTVRSGHNSVKVVSYSLYRDTHPKWFGNTSGKQLCYTCMGDQDEYDLLVDRLAAMIERQLIIHSPVEKYPHNNVISITCSDDMTMCTCETCQRDKAIYNDSGLIIRMWNDVMELVEVWMEENPQYYREDLMFLTNAYYATESPPAKYNATTDEWEPVDETVKFGKHVGITFIPIAADYQQSIFATDNKWVKDMFDGWVACANHPYQIDYMYFNYNCNYHNYFYDAFDFYDTKAMNYFFNHARLGYYAENIHGDTPTEWGALISYVNAKLCYDSTLDSGELIRNWFDACYGPASGVMQNMLMAMRLWNHNETLRTDKYVRRSNRNQVQHLFNWDSVTIYSWIGYADRALEIIEPLKVSDPEEYNRIKYNIELEVVSPYYYLFDTNQVLSTKQIEEIKARLYDNILVYPEFHYVSMGGAFVENWLLTI